MTSAGSADVNLWPSPQHAKEYLQRADSIPHRHEGEAALLEFLPARLSRFLDLGAGGGRLLSLVKSARPASECVALDFSPTMLQVLRDTFGKEAGIAVVEHDLNRRLPALGSFDAVVSSFAIHHVAHERKRTLYGEIFALLNSGGIFLNLEHVASPNESLHEQFLHAIGYTTETEDPSNKLLDFEIQLAWLRGIGFVDVDCHWKWRELALLAGVKPS
ncbi:MAG TPA: class I SAM-dependent methyltransferase [Candidatus Acidoferrum sp.]|nr:class I SAM-dependent methyltransferase [Candidatus Acidoferrum sp.]